MPTRIRIFFVFALIGAVGSASVPTCEPELDYPSQGLELAFSATQLLPNGLPAFVSPWLGYGPAVGWSFGATSLLAKVSVGSLNSQFTYLGEIQGRLFFPNPFLRGYVFAGVHFLQYSDALFSYQYPGIHVGYGLAFGAMESLSASFGIGLYLQERTLVGISGLIAF